jgi:hypothetical protein
MTAQALIILIKHLKEDTSTFRLQLLELEKKDLFGQWKNYFQSCRLHLDTIELRQQHITKLLTEMATDERFKNMKYPRKENREVKIRRRDKTTESD